MRTALLILFAVLLSGGQLLFKKAALAGGSAGLIGALTSGWMVAAVLLYGAATLLWVWLLQWVPLSHAYAFAALAFVLVPFAAAAVFGEAITTGLIVGSVLIVAGIIAVSVL